MADAEIQLAPAAASSSGLRSAIDPAPFNPAPFNPAPLPVRTVLAYGADMSPTLREGSDRSQSPFGTDLVEALQAGTELINTGRDGDDDGLRTVADVQAFGERYAFHGSPAGPGDLPALRARRAR